jgi:hypothetical protein
MAFQYPEIKDFAGIYKQANSFNVPDGALEQAENYVMSADGVLQKQRGYYDYYDATAAGKTLNNLFLYQRKLIALLANGVAYFTETGSDPSKTGVLNLLTGATVAITGDRVSRSAQTNGNMYATTDNGVVKIESYDGTVRKAGVPPALDLRASFNAANGPIAAQTQVAWRVVFGRRDANDGLLLGAPSDIIILTNSKIVGASWSRTANLVTVTTTALHGLATGMQIVVSNSAGAGANEVADGSYTVTVTSSTTFTFAHTAADDAGNTLDYTATRTARLEISIPSEIDSTADGWFVHVNRSSQSGNQAVSPEADFRLLDERELTSAELTAGVLFYDDDLDDLLLGEELYTNPNSREGELQANDRPPLCNDLTVFKNHLIYGKLTTRHMLNLQTIDASALADGEYLEVKVDSTIRRYVARDGIGNSTVVGVASSSAGLLITYTAHGLADGDTVYVSKVTGAGLAVGTYYVRDGAADTFKLTATVGGSAIAYGSETLVEFQGDHTRQTAVTGAAWVRASNVVTVTSVAHGLNVGQTVVVYASAGGTADVALAQYTVVAAPTVDSFTFAETGTDDASGNTLSYAPFVPMFQVDSASASPSVQLRNTAQGVVKAMNRDASALVYARYTSDIDDVPGKMRLQAKGFTGVIYVRGSTSGVGGGMSPTLPASFSTGTQVYSRSSDKPHAFASSKIGEPEAVPTGNTTNVGSRNAELIRNVALRDSMIVIKEDGAFRVTGDSVSNFVVTPIDTTITAIASSSIAVINNQVMFLSNQGIVIVTDSSVQITSRKIEEMIQPIIGDADIETETAAVGYETDRLYMISTSQANVDGTSKTHIYNVLNDRWTESTRTFKQGTVGPSDNLFLISTDNKIVRERKKNTKIDYCGQNYAVTVDAVGADLLSATITSASAAPVAGWVLEKDDIFSRIITVESLGSNQYTVTFRIETNLEAADSVQLYAKYKSTLKLAPFHAGLVGRNKQFSEMAMHFRDTAVSELTIWYTNNFFDSSEYTTWVAVQATADGWGEGPWGAFAWGQADSIEIPTGTLPAPIARTLVPQTVARGTYLQPVIEHDQAGEPVNLQAIAFAVRAYGQRTSK